MIDENAIDEWEELKITHDKNAVYEMCKDSLRDPKQGWLE